LRSLAHPGGSIGHRDVVVLVEARRPVETRAVGYTTLLLDFDHTLFDFDASQAQALRHAVVVGGLPASDEVINAYVEINDRLWAAVSHGSLLPPAVHRQRFRELVERFGTGDDVAMACSFVDGLGQFGDLYPGAREVLTSLAERATLVMVTNSLTAVKRVQTSRLDIEHFFAGIVISEEVGVAKPDKRIFDIALSAAGNPDPSTVLMVGDSLPSDIRGGHNAGLATCWYNPHGRQPSADQAETITHEISDLAELLVLAAGE
jgi:2-haloacid dehalogenase